MENGSYKFENYRNPNFPIYSSVQSGCSMLVRPHYHNDMEFLKVLDGSVKVIIGTKSFICDKDDLVFIVPTVVHSVYSESSDAKICGLVFNPKLLTPIFEFKGCTSNFLVIHKDSQGYNELNNVLISAVDSYGGDGDGYRLKMRAFCLQLLATLTDLRVFLTEPTKNYKVVKPALDYIEQHFAEKITVADLSKIVGQCEGHFIRTFCSETGRTPAAYLVEYRLHEAMKLLSKGQYSVSEIAERTGFCDASYFSRIFKRHIGINPKSYEKTL